MVNTYFAEPKRGSKYLIIFDPLTGKYWGQMELQKGAIVPKNKKKIKGQPKSSIAPPSCEAMSELASLVSSTADQPPSMVAKDQSEKVSTKIEPKVEPTTVKTENVPVFLVFEMYFIEV